MKNEKTLNWRLSELPTAGEVAELVDSEVITVEEAREILFSEKSSSNEKVKALEEQVEFLQGLVTQLANRNTTVTTTPWHYTRTITTPAVYWANTNKVLTSAIGLNVSTATGTHQKGVTMSVSASNKPTIS